ncbi:MAG: XrtA/PEP-CTERM system amidotransferase [Sedimenticola sp.]
MCGIVGIFNLTGSNAINRDLLHRINETQYHRGPDEGGIHIEPGIGLAHRRLSIIDLSSGQQPLFNEDGSVVVTYNGEIYNFKELMRELKDLGHVFKTHCDTEVIVHAWEQWGESCVKRFRGMFAFAIWDRNKKILFLARDRLGIKPLYYTRLENDQFVFSSELKAIQLHPALKDEYDPYAIEEYFAFGYIPDPRTIFKNVKKLPPGHTLTLQFGHALPEPVEYWDVPFNTVKTGTEEDISNELIDRLEEAVKIRMVAEVPLGAFLSGGVDSSAVVALMARNSNNPVNTCSIGFGDPKFNETEFAELVADRYKTNHHLDQVESHDFNLIDKLAQLYDEPYADSSAIPTYRVCQLAKRRVTVALSGDGGDENFAGYRRHRWHMLEEKIRGPIPGMIRRPVFGLLGHFYPKMDWAPKVFRAKTTFQAIARDSYDAYLNSVSVIPHELREKIFSDSFKSQLNGYRAVEVFEAHAKRAPSDDPLSLIQYLDMKTYLPGDILTKVDRASMAHALEVRVPILDHEFVEWVSGLSPDIKLRKREGKYILKKSLENHLPNDVLYRSKMGFGVPISSWFKNELRERVRESVLSERLLDSGVFDGKYLKKLVDDHQSGKRENSAALWSLLMFESFLKNSERA